MISLQKLIVLLLVTIGGMAAAYAYDSWLVLGFMPGFTLLCFYSLKMGVSKHELLESIFSGIASIKSVVYILLLVSLLIPCWMAAGIVSYIIQAGVNVINPAYFLTFAFLLTSTVAMLLGTSTGSLSAVGVPLVGIGSVLGVPAYMSAGAVVSGAFVGDRTSPLASASQLVAAFTGLKMPQHLKALMPTSIAGVACSTVFYMLCDWLYCSGGQAQLSTPCINDWKYFGGWLLFPPFLLVAAIGFRCQTVKAFLLAIISGLVVGSIFQGITLNEWLYYLFIGYVNNDAGVVLAGKGFAYMLPLVFFIIITGAFNGIMERTGLIKPYIRKILGNSSSLPVVTARLGVFGVIVNIICCNQTMPIMLTAGGVRQVWDENFSPSQLSRIVADTSLVVAGLVPWNLFALICSNIIGVPVVGYAGYAVFLWMMPILTILWSYVEGQVLLSNFMHSKAE